MAHDHGQEVLVATEQLQQAWTDTNNGSQAGSKPAGVKSAGVKQAVLKQAVLNPQSIQGLLGPSITVHSSTTSPKQPIPAFQQRARHMTVTEA
jgi:hypothetical protein